MGYYILMILGGSLLFWIAIWNSNHQNKKDILPEVSNTKYVLMMLTGLMALIAGLLFLGKELFEYL